LLVIGRTVFGPIVTFVFIENVVHFLGNGRPFGFFFSSFGFLDLKAAGEFLLKEHACSAPAEIDLLIVVVSVNLLG